MENLESKFAFAVEAYEEAVKTGNVKLMSIASKAKAEAEKAYILAKKETEVDVAPSASLNGVADVVFAYVSIREIC